MIKYRPHRSTLREAMKEAKEFETVDEMYDYIVSNWNRDKELIAKENLSIGEKLGKDPRIDWKETRYVLINRIGDEIYDEPQCIGMCSIED